MLKKIFLCLIVACSSLQGFHEEQYSTLPVIATTATVAVIAMYWAIREPNNVKIARVQGLMQAYKTTMHEPLSKINSVGDIQAYVGNLLEFKKKNQQFFDLVEFSYQEMQARYDSWLKPWNWSQAMKMACEQIQELYQTVRLVKIMGVYSSCIPMLTESTDDETVEKMIHMLCLGKSLYPAIYCVSLIKSDLNFLQNHIFQNHIDVILSNLLETLLARILVCPMYINELRRKEEMEIEHRKAWALQAQANAQQQQAVAQSAQAYAQLAQARAQRERNEIERNKRS
jgi:hypothetical protein